MLKNQNRKLNKCRLCRNEKRNRFLRRRQRKAWKRQHLRNKAHKNKAANAQFYSSALITWLEKSEFAIIQNYKEREFLAIPECFSFTRNPNETIFFLRKLYGIIMCPNVKQVFFDHSGCKNIGICASAIMDILLVECKKWRNSRNDEITFSGKLLKGKYISADHDVDTLLKASGILKHLGISHEKFLDVECLDLLKDESSSDIAEKIIDYINRALYRHGLYLTRKGANYFGKLLGEIADNCSQHGGEYATWYAQGHYSFDPISQNGKCQLVIVDFGDTIYEGLKNSSTKLMKKRIQKYIGRTRMLFPIRESEETLYTLFSLQQRASRFASKKDAVRGNGTAVFLDSFQRLFAGSGSETSKLSITSGKCSIVFDGTYKLREVSYNGKYKNKIIAFNEENDLKKPPDKRYVQSIQQHFPGTVIAMELYINKDLIARKES